MPKPSNVLAKRSDIIVTKDGHFKLTSTDYVFLKYDRSKAKVVPKKAIKPFERVYYCDNCKSVPAIQLDKLYEMGIHDFTLCTTCIKEDEEYLRKLEEKNEHSDNA